MRLTSRRKSVSATGTDHEMLSLCLGQSEDRAALGTFAVNVSFSVLELVLFQSEKAAEFFVFPSPFLHVSGEHTEKDENEKGYGQ